MNFSKLTTPQLQAKLLLADRDQKKQIQDILAKRSKAAQDTASLTGEDDVPEVDIITKEKVVGDKTKKPAAALAKKAKTSNRGANQVPELLGKIAKFPSRNGQQPIEGEIVKAFVDQRDLKVYVGVVYKEKMYFKQKDKAEIKGVAKPATKAPVAAPAPAAKATVATPAKKVVPAKKAAKKA